MELQLDEKKEEKYANSEKAKDGMNAMDTIVDILKTLQANVNNMNENMSNVNSTMDRINDKLNKLEKMVFDLSES